MIKTIINCNQSLNRQFALVRLASTSTRSQIYSAFPKKRLSTTKQEPQIPSDFRFRYCDFLPSPEMKFRNPIREKIERSDMLNRRNQLNVPEFYVGSIVAVSSSDVHAAKKTNRFLGICIQKQGAGLRTHFVLRNCIDNQGVEIKFELYDPTIQKIEVIRLEKRLDSDLQYLRDCEPEFSTFDLNMEAEILAEGSEIPVNPLKVKLRPRPWTQKWERKELQGIENVNELLYDKHRRKAEKVAKPWEKYDLMMQYRKTIPEEEQCKIFSEIQPRLNEINEENKKKVKAIRRGAFTKPNQLG